MGNITIQSKKQEQFRCWVSEYSDMMYAHARIRGFDPDAAKDLVQDTFYSAWKNIDNFEGKASPRNWLFVILKNKITDTFRKAFTQQTKILISEYDAHFDGDGHWAGLAYPKELTINPSDASDRNEFHSILESCSSKLNKLQKAVFYMKYLDELDSDDICLQLEISANNYWTILHRAKVQLRSCLEKNWLLVKNV